ncbi:hypothetical protein RFI_07573 [Reticulomyxa filosa]|uniref:Trafficking protein particle complex subunit n=1 Tax=Reticulomyxa filosa TaxID=46433 RepID=X6NU62_RETFI|nr:hypothetical protein RFI_07573 [Reticulomyxa filosa]|eukprot:ETO29546.1 hypothetical protein RFI_07573 [Reticulomyxa filosa]
MMNAELVTSDVSSQPQSYSTTSGVEYPSTSAPSLGMGSGGTAPPFVGNTFSQSSAIGSTSNKKQSIFDDDLNAHMNKSVSLSAFSHLFCGLLQYCREGIKDVGTLENRLSGIGYQIGIKQLELITHRLRPMKRETNHVSMLEFITKDCWKHIFGRLADGLEQSMQNDNEFFIVDHKPVTNRFVSLPPDMVTFNPASFIAGIIHGMLESAGFKCNVIALDQESDNESKRPKRTLFIVQFKNLHK